jgi:hypothetical protein
VTRRLSRRGLLGAAAALIAVGGARRAHAADYTSAIEALSAVEGFEAEVERYWLRLHRIVPGSRPMLESFGRDRERHRAHRARVRRRLGLGPSASPAASEAPAAPLAAVREAQSALVYAHAEALPTLNDAVSVGLLIGDMVDLARHLTLVDLWIEAEATRA